MLPSSTGRQPEWRTVRCLIWSCPCADRAPALSILNWPPVVDVASTFVRSENGRERPIQVTPENGVSLQGWPVKRVR